MFISIFTDGVKDLQYGMRCYVVVSFIILNTGANLVISVGVLIFEICKKFKKPHKNQRSKVETVGLKDHNTETISPVGKRSKVPSASQKHPISLRGSSPEITTKP